MRRTNRIVPTYTGDVSGACSALFELGGMVVIHDPSGCNSTYNTHDETRWYDWDSLIFITGLTERDAILGNDEKLVRDVVEAARELRPRFVALCNSPIPFISGTDFAAICKLVEREIGVPCFYVRTNAMHDYVVGGWGRRRLTLVWPARMHRCVPLPRRQALRSCRAGPWALRSTSWRVRPKRRLIWLSPLQDSRLHAGCASALGRRTWWGCL